MSRQCKTRKPGDSIKNAMLGAFGVSQDTLRTARKKPLATSDVRWRIELRRRAMRRDYLAWMPDPDRL